MEYGNRTVVGVDTAKRVSSQSWNVPLLSKAEMSPPAVERADMV